MKSAEKARLTCGNCGGALDIDPEKPTAVCSFCGSCYSVSELLNETEQLKLERIRRDVELGRQNLELARIRQAEAVRNDSALKEEVAKKSFLGRVAIILAVISLAMCVYCFFVIAAPLSGCIAGVQCVLFVVSFFIGQQVIPTRSKRLHILPFTLAALLAVPFSLSIAMNEELQPTNDAEVLSWNEIVLSDRIPELYSDEGYLMKNTRDDLMVSVYDIPIKEYYGFVDGCKDMGYTVDSIEDVESYTAFAADGFRLSVRYSVRRDGTVEIHLFAPKDGEEFSRAS